MKRLKYSMCARIIAIILAAVFGLLAAANGIAVLFMYGIGIYQDDISETLKEHQTELQRYYSTKVFTEMTNGRTKDVLKDAGMEYGILQADSIEDIDLTDTSQYLYQNFKETTPQKDSYCVSFNKNASSIYCGNTPTLLDALTERLYYGTGHPKMESCQEKIQRIVYCTDKNQFYFEGNSYSFPICQVSVDESYLTRRYADDTSEIIDGEDNIFYYDDTQKAYLSNSDIFKPLSSNNYAFWGLIGIPNVSDDGYTEQYYFRTEDIEKTTGKKLKPLCPDSSYLIQLTGTSQLFDKKSYPSLTYLKEADSKGNVYVIVSNITETDKDSLFLQQANALTRLYEFRTICVVLTILSGICFLLLTAFCCYSAGCQKDTDTFPIRFLHRVPLLIYLTGTAFCMFVLFSSKYLLYRILFANTRNSFSILFLNGTCTILGILLFLAVVMNLSVRFKAKVLYRYTVCFYILRTCRRFFRRYIKKWLCSLRHILQAHTSLAAKCICGFAVLTIIDFYFALTFYNGTHSLLLWMFIKLAELTALLFAAHQLQQLQNRSRQLAEGNFESRLDTEHMLWEFKKHGNYLNQISNGMTIALEEKLKSEHFKTELITNVSHDIKTPLTSIINYVDLLCREPYSSEAAKEYLEILVRQSARLKKLIEDLIEASKASTGNLSVNLEECDVSILLAQTIGEFEERLQQNDLTLITQQTQEPVILQADNRHLWRIFDNLMNNICKYAQPGTRVYINFDADADAAHIIFRNTSKYPLNISESELTERFVRGDASRNTEGNGLGLSIAQSLAELMHGSLEIRIDGDLFKAIVTLPLS